MRTMTVTVLTLITLAARGQAPIPKSERDALVAVFSATAGTQWKDRTGWLGEPGTECDWHGVECVPEPDETGAAFTNHVAGLRLEENNLRGAIPDEALQLTRLDSAWLWDNALESVPAAWVDKEDRGSLDLRIWGNPLRGRVSEISIEEMGGSLLCAHSMTVVTERGDITFAAIRCRNRTPADRTTYCEMKRGGPYYGFRRLSRFVEKSGFFDLKPGYTVNQTHAQTTIVRVVRDGKQWVVDDYGYAEPLELFGIQLAIHGVIADLDWDRTTKHPTSVCSDFFDR